MLKGRGLGQEVLGWIGKNMRGDANHKTREVRREKYLPSSSEFAISFSTPERPISRLRRGSWESDYSDPFGLPLQVILIQ